MDGKQEISLTRTFDAPIERVWNAWTTPEGWTAWFGQPGHVKEGSVEIDAQIGGKWKSTTVYDAGEITFSGTFTELDKPNKIMMTFENPENPDDPNVETVIVTFTDIGDHKTEMNFTQKGSLPPEEYDKGLRAGWTGFFDALETYLTKA